MNKVAKKFIILERIIQIIGYAIASLILITNIIRIIVMLPKIEDYQAYVISLFFSIACSIIIAIAIWIYTLRFESEAEKLNLLQSINDNILSSNNTTNNNPNYKYDQHDIIFDVMTYKDCINIQQELLTLKGKPKENKTLDKITTLYYENEEYNFYENRLAWIVLTKKYKYNSKDEILSKFGLKSNNKTSINDAGNVLTYYNCGIPKISMEYTKNTLNNIIIIFLEEFV